MQTLIFRISRLVKNAKGQWSLRCSEGYSKVQQGASSLAHFDFGCHFASGVPNAVKRDVVSWTSKENEFRIKVNFSAAVGAAILEAALEIPELQAPPLDDDGVSQLRSWQVHVVVDDQAEVSLGKRDDAVLHWDSEQITLVHTNDPAFARFERLKVNTVDIWEELGLKFEAPKKDVLSGDEARDYLRSLKTSRNATRRQKKAERCAEEENSQVKRLEF